MESNLSVNAFQQISILLSENLILEGLYDAIILDVDSKVPLIALVTSVIISCLGPVVGDVHELVSSLSSTGRNHVCNNELLTFSCEVSGPYLSWVIDSTHRTILFGNQPIDTVQTISNIKAILTMNNEIEGGSELQRRLRSALLIESSQYTNFSNLSCSSEGDIRTLTFREAEIPSTPDDLIVHYLAQSSSQRSSVISVMWSAPENVERFDLEYYIVQVLVSEPDKSYLLNGTTTELEYIFDLDSVSVMSRIQVMVTAVSKCGKHSQTSKMPPEMIDFGEPQAQSMALNVVAGYHIQSLCAGISIMAAVIFRKLV